MKYMLRFTRDVAQMARRRGRNVHITLSMDVVNVRKRSPHACVSSQEKKS